MIYYFSGTGNTRHIAYRLAERLVQQTENIGIMPSHDWTNEHVVGLAFPTYGWTLPPLVLRWLEALPVVRETASEPQYIFAVLTCGDEIGFADEHLRTLLRHKGYELSAVWSIQMPNTYVGLPFFDTDSSELEQRKLTAAVQRLEEIVQAVLQSRTGVCDVQRGSFPALRSGMLSRFFFHYFASPRLFHTHGRCTGCQRCVRLCPLGNIRVDNAKVGPTWGKDCTFCLACYHCCPVQNIQLAPFSQRKGQYQRFIAQR